MFFRSYVKSHRFDASCGVPGFLIRRPPFQLAGILQAELLTQTIRLRFLELDPSSYDGPASYDSHNVVLRNLSLEKSM